MSQQFVYIIFSQLWEGGAVSVPVDNGKQARQSAASEGRAGIEAEPADPELRLWSCVKLAVVRGDLSLSEMLFI